MQNSLSGTCDCCIIVRIRGRVQGVGFRFFTHQQAKKLKLVGYVKNLIDGQVEIVACGLDTNIAMLIDWLNKGGPPSAKIQNYSLNSFIPTECYKAFNVRY